MLQLIYVSTAHDGWDRRFDLLCAQASVNNVRDEITGILCQQHGSFLQVLEGPRVTVEDTFIRIVTDPRHQALSLLSRRLLTRREFGEWAMAGLTDDECAAATAQVQAIVAANPPMATMLRDRFAR